MNLLTVEEVANILKISPNTVYLKKNRLGGFYPAGIKVLRFREDDIYGLMERQNTEGLEVQFPVSGKESRRRRIQDQSRSQNRPRNKTSAGKREWITANPERYGL
jgi:hypothetical protein